MKKIPLYKVVSLLKNIDRKIIIIGASILLLLIIFLFIVTFFDQKEPSFPQKEWVFQDPLTPPEEPGITDSYLLHRHTEKLWSDADVKKWFHPITDEDKVQLEFSNDIMIKRILEEAP